jgi:hypothetical protein
MLSTSSLCLRTTQANATLAKNAKHGACSKDYFENHMTIHFKREWLDTYQKDKNVNKVGARLGFAYGSGYWTMQAIHKWLPDKETIGQCIGFYEL